MRVAAEMGVGVAEVVQAGEVKAGVKGAAWDTGAKAELSV